MNEKRRRTYIKNGGSFNENSAYAIALNRSNNNVVDVYGANDGINFELIRSFNLGVRLKSIDEAYVVSKTMTIDPGTLGQTTKIGSTITDDHFLIFSVGQYSSSTYHNKYTYILPISSITDEDAFIKIDYCVVTACNDYGRFYMEISYNSSSGSKKHLEVYTDDFNSYSSYWECNVTNNYYGPLSHCLNGPYCLTIENGIGEVGYQITNCDTGKMSSYVRSGNDPKMSNVVPYPTKSFLYKWNNDIYNDTKTYLSYIYQLGTSFGGNDITQNTNNGKYNINYDLSIHYGISSSWDEIYRVSLTINPSNGIATYGSETRIPIDGGSRYLCNKNNWGGSIQSSSLFTKMKYLVDSQSTSEELYVVMSNNAMQSLVTCTGLNESYIYHDTIKIAVHPDTVF